MSADSTGSTPPASSHFQSHGTYRPGDGNDGPLPTGGANIDDFMPDTTAEVKAASQPVENKAFDLLNPFLSANGEQIVIDEKNAAEFARLFADNHQFKSELVTFANNGDWSKVKAKDAEWQHPMKAVPVESVDQVVARLARDSIKAGYQEVAKVKKDVARHAVQWAMQADNLVPKVFAKFLNNLRVLSEEQVEKSFATAGDAETATDETKS